MGVQSFLRDAPLIVESGSCLRVLQVAASLASQDRPLLIKGESETGNSQLATFLRVSGGPRFRGLIKFCHSWQRTSTSPRSNTSALPRVLLHKPIVILGV